MSRSIVNIEEFLQDEEFVRWVKAPTRESNQYWKSWAKTHPESNANMIKARELLLSMHFHIPKPSDQERQAVLEQILKSTNTSYHSTQSNKGKNWVHYALRIAAGLLLLASLIYILQIFSQSSTQMPKPLTETVVVKETARGVKMQTKLPDGTHVWLNTESKLSYKQSYGVNDRVVELTGEAYFEVAKDTAKPFIVRSGELMTQALGTAFNVRAFPQDKSIEIALVTGKVAVHRADQNTDPFILYPGKMVSHVLESEQFIETSFTYDQEIGWKDEVLCFEGADFQEVKQKIERWYGVTIHTAPLLEKDWNYTAKFDNQSLELVLKRMSFTKSFDFRIDGQDVYLYNKN